MTRLESCSPGSQQETTTPPATYPLGRASQVATLLFYFIGGAFFWSCFGVPFRYFRVRVRLGYHLLPTLAWVQHIYHEISPISFDSANGQNFSPAPDGVRSHFAGTRLLLLCACALTPSRRDGPLLLLVVQQAAA